MDIEKLKSIIRLANNNPNENEANLAARKACKVLAENDYSLLRPTRTAQEKVDQHASNYRTWNDVKRSTESEWSSKPKTPNYKSRQNEEDWSKKYAHMWENRVYDPVYDAANDAYSYDGGKTWKSRREAKYQEDIKYKPFTGGPKKKEVQDRVCSKCGLKVSTYRYKEEPFVCNVCHWKDML